MTRAFKGMLLTAMVLALLAVGFGPAASAGKKTRLLHYAAQGAPKGVRAEALKWWASEIEKRTGGSVKIKIYWSGALLKAGDAMEGIGSRTADLGGAWGIYHPAKTPLWTVGDPPFSHDDPYVGIRAIQEMFATYQPLIDELAKYNVKVLAPFVTGMTQLGSVNRAVHVPADTAGMKIRFAGGQWAAFWKSVGAVPIKLTQGEVYEALMRGTADATQSYFFILEAYKHWDVIKYYTVINAGELCSYGLAINLDVWKSLSPEIQKIITQASNEFVLRYAKGLIDVRKKVITQGKAKGMKFINLDKAQKDKWLAKAKPLIDAWAKGMDAKGLPGTQTQQTFLKLVEKYSQEVNSKGYPWGK
jgi:TRAP-type C4-dicarboxylate transport system substrate-binding protein